MYNELIAEVVKCTEVKSFQAELQKLVPPIGHRARRGLPTEAAHTTAATHTGDLPLEIT